MRTDTTFTERAAVDAWDAWYRWRDAGDLRDITVEDTWARVADAVAVVEGARAGAWSSRFIDAFANWRLLPDERLLRDAGTGRPLRLATAPHAALNAAAFVGIDGGGLPAFDSVGFGDTAALAVRVLDNALALAGDATPDRRGLRIGLIGLSDALTRLGLRYDRPEGHDAAFGIVAALATGCLRGAIELAAERGARAPDAEQALASWRRRGIDAGLLADGRRWGMRHHSLTVIEPRPRLALLANNVADALDPMIDPGLPRLIHIVEVDAAMPPAAATIRIEGRRGGPSPVLFNTLSSLPIESQLALRARVQPWVDRPIDYPLLAWQVPDTRIEAALAELASRHGMPAPGWRLADEAA